MAIERDPAKVPEFQNSIALVAIEVLREELDGLTPARVQQIADEIGCRSVRQHAGRVFYIAKGHSLDVSARNQAIFDRYRKDRSPENIIALATEFGISQRHLHRIVADCKRVERLRDDEDPSREQLLLPL